MRRSLPVMPMVFGLLLAPAAGLAEAVHAAVHAGCALLDHDHAAWTALLKRHVSNGPVDYAGLQREGGAERRLRIVLDRAASLF